MRDMDSGIGFLVLICSILFTWLMVATYVSPELAAFMGVLLIGLWVLLFVPLGLLRELVWQSRQQKIITGSGGMVAYKAGNALPPPMQAYGSGSSGGLMVVPESRGGAVDILRDLPTLPPLEPRPHASMFKRSLALPFIGICMFWGANNDHVLHWLLRMRGIVQHLPVNWEKITLPPAYASYESELHEAIRLTLRREPACQYIHTARLVAQDQYISPQKQAEEIDDGRYVYEFTCGKSALGTTTQGTFLSWITADDLGYTSFGSLMHVLDRTPDRDAAWGECAKAGQVFLKTKGYQLIPSAPPQMHTSTLPFRGYIRFYGLQSVITPQGLTSKIGMACWAHKNQAPDVRFSPATEGNNQQN